MMNNTPAPWTPSFHIDHDPTDGPVITGFSINGPNDESVLWYCEYSSVENAADVPLITAAPNLLAVCRDALRKLERDGRYKDLQAELRDVIAYAAARRRLRQRVRDCDSGRRLFVTRRRSRSPRRRSRLRGLRSRNPAKSSWGQAVPDCRLPAGKRRLRRQVRLGIRGQDQACESKGLRVTCRASASARIALHCHLERRPAELRLSAGAASVNSLDGSVAPRE